MFLCHYSILENTKFSKVSNKANQRKRCLKTPWKLELAWFSVTKMVDCNESLQLLQQRQ